MVFILFDTDIVQRMATYGEFLYDGAMDASATHRVSGRHGAHEVHELSALREILRVAQRGSLPIAVSERTVQELARTRNQEKRMKLLPWALELLDWWISNRSSLVKLTSRRIAERIDRHLNSGRLDFLPDPGDRWLIAEALVIGCDTFLTMDRKTILVHHRRLHGLGVDALSPYDFVQKYRHHLAAA